ALEKARAAGVFGSHPLMEPKMPVATPKKVVTKPVAAKPVIAKAANVVKKPVTNGSKIARAD
ncbi:MAG: hypothetical protein ACHQVK_01070, partial [Candidatus Paceibacterales bacterium]